MYTRRQDVVREILADMRPPCPFCGRELTELDDCAVCGYDHSKTLYQRLADINSPHADAIHDAIESRI